MINVTDIIEELGLIVVFEASDRVACECPFTAHEHDNIRPGFSVRVNDGRWICFKGCGQGQLRDLVSKLNGVDRAEADRWLLLHGGSVDSVQLLSHLDSTKRAIDQTVDIRIFQEDYDRQRAKSTSQYILDRGFTIETLQSWEFRYDPDVPAIVIPLFSLDHELVGIGRREVVAGAQPRKYMYSPGAKIDQILFGAYRHPRESGRTVIVEGPLDCVWLHQCGITDTVALLGAHCSSAQQRILARLGHRVVLALDNDAGGFRAMRKLGEQLSSWFGVERARIPEVYNDVQEMPEKEVLELFNE